MPEQTTELIQSIGYAISAVIGVITFLVVTLPNFFKRIKPLRAAVERMLESEPPSPAPVVNGNGSAVVALTTAGQAQQMILVDLTQKVNDLTDALRKFTEADAEWKAGDFARFRGEVTGRLLNLTGRVEVLEGKSPRE